MLNKKYIKELKFKNNGELSDLLNPKNDYGTLYFVLDNLGRLPSNFDGGYFIPLVKHENSKIRLLAVKNIGKLANIRFLHLLDEISANDQNTLVRREAISSIGRMRSEKTISVLLKKLCDNDPKVILQVIRALLVFKHKLEVKSELEKLKSHPNEIISSVIEKEYTPSQKYNYSKPKRP